MELADMQDLGSCAERRMGSTPFIRTILEKPCDCNGRRVFQVCGMQLLCCWGLDCVTLYVTQLTESKRPAVVRLFFPLMKNQSAILAGTSFEKLSAKSISEDKRIAV